MSTKVRLTRDQIEELQVFEVDTLDAGAPAGKAEFVEALRLVPWKGGTITLSGPALQYAARETGPFGNTADILRDQGRNAMAAAFERKLGEAQEAARES